MTAAKQGFVQAFTRLRSDCRDHESPVENALGDSALGMSENISSLLSRPDLAIASEASPVVLELDSSVASSASLWAEKEDGLITRVDQVLATQPSSPVDGLKSAGSRRDSGETNLNDDSLEPVDSIRPMQHTFTAYDAASDHGIFHRARQLEKEKASTNSAETSPIDMLGKRKNVNFQPAWEVDSFHIPRLVDTLFVQDGLLNKLSVRLFDAVNAGLSSLAVTSVQLGEGKTSVALGIALSAATSGLKVALVDANFDHPSLTDQLHLDVEHGWGELSSGIGLDEIAVHSLNDHLTIFPLHADSTVNESIAESSESLLLQLRSYFDFVVIDGGSKDSLVRSKSLLSVDSAVIVQNPSKTPESSVCHYAQELRQVGIQSIGVVKNFD